MTRLVASPVPSPLTALSCHSPAAVSSQQSLSPLRSLAQWLMRRIFRFMRSFFLLMFVLSLLFVTVTQVAVIHTNRRILSLNWRSSFPVSSLLDTRRLNESSHSFVGSTQGNVSGTHLLTEPKSTPPSSSSSTSTTTKKAEVLRVEALVDRSLPARDASLQMLQNFANAARIKQLIQSLQSNGLLDSSPDSSRNNVTRLMQQPSPHSNQGKEEGEGLRDRAIDSHPADQKIRDQARLRSAAGLAAGQKDHQAGSSRRAEQQQVLNPERNRASALSSSSSSLHTHQQIDFPASAVVVVDSTSGPPVLPADDPLLFRPHSRLSLNSDVDRRISSSSSGTIRDKDNYSANEVSSVVVSDVSHKTQVMDQGMNWSASHLSLFQRVMSVQGNKSTLCPAIPSGLLGRLVVDMESEPPQLSQVEGENKDVSSGGHYSPSDCVSRHRVAIIIPFRDRWQHLRLLLSVLHPMLQRQQLEYAIYVSEQADNETFNKGVLMNAAVRQALQDQDYDCFVFHDVDLIPEDDRNLYSCPPSPRHLSPAIDKFNYT